MPSRRQPTYARRVAPNNRELAGLILLIIACALLAGHPRTRSSALAVVRTALQAVILVPFILMAAYACGLVALAAWIGWWDSRLLVETVLWVVGPGVGLLYGAATSKSDELFFRHTVRRAWRLTGFVEVLVGLYVLSLPAELILIPVATVLGLMSLVGGTRPEFEPAKRVVDVLLSVLVIALLAYVIAHLFIDRHSLDLGHIFGAFALPPYLTLGFIPYLYGIALWAAYDHVFRAVNFHIDDRGVRWRVKIGLVIAFGARPSKAKAFSFPRAQCVASAQTVAEGRAAGRAFLQAELQKDQAEREAAERLVRNAGIEGTDADGRRLDEREFNETRIVLQWLATAQMGWFRNQGGRYRSDLLRMLAPFDGLPENHGLELAVADDGQSWCAWRRTITGWCFAVGAAGPPPDQWLYDGPNPPEGFPGEDPAMGERWGATAENW